MSILKNLTDLIARKGSLGNIFMTNWKPKLICLVLAVLVWFWVEFRYVRQSDEWDASDEVRLSLPDADY